MSILTEKSLKYCLFRKNGSRYTEYYERIFYFFCKTDFDAGGNHDKNKL